MLILLGNRILYSHIRNQVELYILARKKCDNIFLCVKSKTEGYGNSPFVCIISNSTH